MGQTNSIVKLIKTMGQIAEGVKNSVWKKEHVEEIAKARMQVCTDCVHIDREGSSCMVPGTQPCCGKCGCKLSLKVRSLSSACADDEYERWPAVMTQEDEDELREDIGHTEEE